MESKIEELTDEIQRRTEFLQKEKDEVEAIRLEAKKNNSFKIDQQRLLKKKKEDQQRELQQNKKIQNEIEKLARTKQLREADLEKYNKELHEREQILKTADQTAEIAGQKIEALLESEPWISQDERFFGKEGTMYDFKDVEPLQLAETIKEMESERDVLKRKFDPRVDELAKKNQEQFLTLERKRDTIKADKEKLEETIASLDLERNKDIKKTVTEVSKSFGEIYSVLLPGTGARLAPSIDAEGSITGLNLKVAFGGVEKDSLSELSGGQKSLLALSLILALLKYQPAPFYILDEIDSALDLSHTQNIGLMIRKYFQASQFLIVSLKQGLFQNANVLFQVSFQENRSCVKRLQIRKNQNEAF